MWTVLGQIPNICGVPIVAEKGGIGTRYTVHVDCMGQKPKILASTEISLESLRAKWSLVTCHKATYRMLSGVWAFLGSCVTPEPTSQIRGGGS